MGTTFVSLSRQPVQDDPGFWMSDSMLELWLRLLARHLPEPTDSGENSATRDIRNQWLLASRGYFTGCVPHGLGDACLTNEVQTTIRSAIASLLDALQSAAAPLEPATLNLLGIDGHFTRPIERSSLIDIGHAFLDLFDGRVNCLATSTEIMPGSKPYRRRTASS
jgi:hypothetical protein